MLRNALAPHRNLGPWEERDSGPIMAFAQDAGRLVPAGFAETYKRLSGAP